VAVDMVVAVDIVAVVVERVAVMAGVAEVATD
jgi:hypothetical protein